ncbi:MAG: hypothetical protein Q3X85_04585, partial [Eubacterium sp.]|nr:hypothetical protein [Eubacterium sp.]
PEQIIVEVKQLKTGCNNEKSDRGQKLLSLFDRRISIPPLQVRRALSGGMLMSVGVKSSH